MSALITPNTSTDSKVCTLPVLGSGLSNSSVFPRDTTISCSLAPLKLPCTECVTPDARWRVRLYKYMLAAEAQEAVDQRSI